MSAGDSVTFTLELGMLNFGIAKEINRKAFEKNLECEYTSGRGFSSKTFTFRITEKPDSKVSVSDFVFALQHTLE